MTILDYIIVAGAALVGIVGVAWALVFCLRIASICLNAERGKDMSNSVFTGADQA